MAGIYAVADTAATSLAATFDTAETTSHANRLTFAASLERTAAPRKR